MPNPLSHYDIFVSYAKEDSDFVRRLVEALRAKQMTVWYDRGELRLGDAILRDLEDGLEHSDFFVLVLSPEYLKKAWSQFETGVALGRHGKNRILPIFLRHSNRAELVRFAPSVADTASIDADKLSLEEIATNISETIKRQEEGSRNGHEQSHDVS